MMHIHVLYCICIILMEGIVLFDDASVACNRYIASILEEISLLHSPILVS